MEDIPTRPVHVTWPYLADTVDSSLDPDLIERHGREILARAVTHGRLVAFVGAGMSMAYGRLSWQALVRMTLEEVESITRGEGQPEAAARIALQRRTLKAAGLLHPDNRLAEAPADANPLLILQLCRDMLGEGRLETLFRNSLESPGLRDGLVVSAGQRLRHEGVLTGTLPCRPRLDVEWPSRRRFIAVLDGTAAAGGVQHGAGTGSPLALLAQDLGVRRFATTNYDREIERALAAPQALPDGPGDAGADAPAVPSFSLHDGTSARGIGFAVEGRRRHAAVMHLHGSIRQPDRMIISEVDYREHYLKPSHRRDLLDSAIRQLFGANPVLYVGSSVSEDDVLRPLREFMSIAPRRADRLGIALLPANRCLSRLVREKIECHQRFGIFVIHYGFDLPDRPELPTQHERKFPTKPGAEPWLFRFTEAVTGLKKRLRLLAQPVDPLRNASLAVLALECAGQPPTAPRCMDGQAYPSPDLDIGFELELVQRIGQHYPADRREPLDPALAESCLCLLDEALNSVTSAFVCARLKTERAFHRYWSRQLADPFEGLVRRQLRFDEHGTYVHLRLQESPPDGCPPTRFAPNHPSRLPPRDARWDEFRDSLVRHRRFTDHDGRRLVLLPMQRGAGKGSMFDALAQGDGVALRDLQSTLSPRGQPVAWRSGLISFNFLSDVADIADVIASVVGDPPNLEQTEQGDALEHVVGRLEQALAQALSRRGGVDPAPRSLLVLANVGVLFDSHGEAKNGLVLRLLRLLMSRRFAWAPIDFLVFCDEDHVPSMFRVPDGPDRNRTSTWQDDEAPVRERYERSNRLRLRGIAQPDLRATSVHVHSPRRSRAREVAALFGIGWEDAPDRPVLQRLHRAVGGSRIAMTLIFALLAEERPDAPRERQQQWIDTLATTLLVHAPTSMPDGAIQLVLDRWQLLHRRRPEVLRAPPVAGWLDGALMRADATAADRFWALCTELLWHLAAFSHPVEMAVLLRCPGITAALDQVDKDRRKPLLQAALELCVHRCLALRMSPRTIELPEGCADPKPCYTVHRAVQRHFLRTTGGRDVEGIEWDQFTVSTYISQPDEIPTLRPQAHEKLTEIVQRLTRYGEEPEPAPPRGTAWLEEMQALRAAYFLARSTYSVGVLSHIASHGVAAGQRGPVGHMELYRRLVRWITHRAEYLSGDRSWRYFHQGEVVWLYAECGVMSLTQGKLEDAEPLLMLALRAARRLECDDTGSLHVRLLLHLALTRIERGRPRSAKRMLEPIAQRRDGHEMPPLIATFYLGVIEHLGGDYHQARVRYEVALQGFRRLGRTRATAFVLRALADLRVVHQPAQVREAIALAEEAMALAQRGGHEDVRIMASLSLVRLRTKLADGHDRADSYRLLDTADRYADAMSMPRIRAAAHEVRATLLLSQGETRHAVREASTSAEIAALYDLKLFKIKAMLTLARICKLRGDSEQAKVLIADGLEMAYASEYLSCMRDFMGLDAGAPTAPAAT